MKTSVLYYLNRFKEDERQTFLEDHLADLCASFQQAIVDVLIEGLGRAIDETGAADVAVVGGVSANSALRREAEVLARRKRIRLHIPDPIHSVDNGAMIAMTGHFKLAAGLTSPLTLTADPILAL